MGRSEEFLESPHIRKLERFATLSRDESLAMEEICGQVVERPAGTDLIREGERPKYVHILLEGWAYRYKILPDGGRQIMAYLIPGDWCDLHIFILKRMDHSIGLLSDARVALIAEERIIELLDNQPRIARAMFWASLVDEATLREWLANTLRRPPFERLAHLLCELWLRMNAVGLVQEDAFDLPLTQAELGDTIGLNPVSVNRVLQRMRAEGLIKLGGRYLTLLDSTRMMALSKFDPNYLHLTK